jgi:outer membrane protein OmpA-like peptidoglycan-associated protein
MRGIGRMVATGLLVLIVSAANAKAEEASYSLAVGRADAHAYAVSVGISMLAKINILPRYDVDLDVLVSENSADSIDRLQAGQAALAMIDPQDLDPAAAGQILSVAMIWHSSESAPLLAARQDVPPDAIYQITKMIFENLPSLQTIDSITADTNLDAAVLDLPLPLHEGAKRYYRELAVALPDIAVPQATVEQAAADAAGVPVANVPAPEVTEPEIAEAPAVPRAAAGNVEVATFLPAVGPGTGPVKTKNPVNGTNKGALARFFGKRTTGGGIGAKTFVVYFDFNEAALDDRSEATLAELETFAKQLGDARAWVAGFTDSVGSADYNLELAKRRVNAVIDALDKIGLKATIEVSALGEQSPWIVSGDETREALNRRVEIVVELAPDTAAQHTPRRSKGQELKSGSLM